MFVVLSGIHNALREQTQDRLNSQLWRVTPTLASPDGLRTDFVPTANVDALLAPVISASSRSSEERTASARVQEVALRSSPESSPPVRAPYRRRADQASVNTAKPDRSHVINRLITDIVNASPGRPTSDTRRPRRQRPHRSQGFRGPVPPATSSSTCRARSTTSAPRRSSDAKISSSTTTTDQGRWHDFIRTIPATEVKDLRPKGSASRAEFEPSVTRVSMPRSYFLLSTASPARARTAIGTRRR